MDKDEITGFELGINIKKNKENQKSFSLKTRNFILVSLLILTIIGFIFFKFGLVEAIADIINLSGQDDGNWMTTGINSSALYNTSTNQFIFMCGYDDGGWFNVNLNKTIQKSGMIKQVCYDLAVDTRNQLVYIAEERVAGPNGNLTIFDIQTNQTRQISLTQHNVGGTQFRGVTTDIYDNYTFFGVSPSSAFPILSYYDARRDVLISLDTNDDGNWINHDDKRGEIYDVLYVRSINRTYIAGMFDIPGTNNDFLFGWFDLQLNKTFNLTFNNANNWFNQYSDTNSRILALTYDSKRNITIFAGEHGMIGYFNETSNQTVNLNGTAINNWVAETNINSLWYDSQNDITWMTLDSGKYGYLDINKNQSIDLSGVDSGNFIGSNKLTSVIHDNRDNKTYFTGYGNTFAVYYNTSGVSGAGNNIPSFTTNPYINSTNGLNSTIRNLTVTFIATDLDTNDILNYSIQVFRNNISNFTIVNLTTNRDVFTIFRIDYRNLTNSAGSTYKAQVIVNDNNTGSTSYINTSELLLINSVPSIPTLNFPVHNLMTANYTPLNLSANGSIDEEGDAITYQYWLDRNTDPPTTNVGNGTTETYEFNSSIDIEGRYFWRVRASDSNGGNSDYTSTRTFLVDRKFITENVSIFTSPDLQGSSSNFRLNITFNRTTTFDVNATFTYNNTLFNVTKTNYKDNGRLYNVDVTTPISNNLINFGWNLTINQNNNTLIYNNSYIGQQSLIPINLTNCTAPSSNQAVAVNFTIRDEINNTIQNGSFQGTFIFWSSSKNVNLTSYFNENEFTNVRSVLLCISPAYATLSSEAEISYISQGFQARQYYFRNTTLNNQTQAIPLYLLHDSKSTGISFQVVDSVGNALSNHIIDVQAHDIGNNTLITVAMGKTDFEGDYLIYLRANNPDAPYRFRILDSIGRILFKSSTDTFITGNIVIRIAPSGSIIEFLKILENVEKTLTFNSGTSTYTYSFSDSSGKVIQSNLKILRRTAESETVLVNQLLIGTSGSFSYTLPNNNTGVYVATASVGFVEDSGVITNLPLISIQNEIIDTANKLYTVLGRDGILGTVFVIGTFTMLGITSSVLVVIFSLIALFFVWVMGFIELSTLLITLMILVGGGILFYKLKT